MMDQRVRALAEQVIVDSVSLGENQRVLIEAWNGAEDFACALVEAAYRAKGRPFVTLQSSLVNRALYMAASEEGMADRLRYERPRMEEMDAYIAIRRQENIFEYADLPPEQLARQSRFSGILHGEVRIPHTKWCVLRYPNAAMAQLAGMSTPAFTDYYFSACCLDYKRMRELIAPLRLRFAQGDRVRILAPGTDLSFSVKGLCEPASSCGLKNLPCGEVGMPVVPDSANGVISYNIPSHYLGHEYRNVRLALKDGLIVEATASDTTRLNRVLDTDENARRIGEFSLGINPYITKPILDILFDEKMTGSLHFTPGNSAVNPSAIHWDLVTSHVPEYGGGEVWLDGELLRKDGLFVPEEFQALNPENLKKEISFAF